MQESLCAAAERGDTATVRALLRQGAETSAALLKVVQRGRGNMLRCLLEAGVDVNRQDAQGSTPLIHAARAGDPAVVEMLLDAGADVNHRNRQGDTALTYGWPNPAVLRVLATRGADLDARYINGQTLLMLLAERSLTESAALLLEQGADPNARDRDGNTALYYAELHKGVRLAEMLRDRGGMDPISPETRRATGDLYRAAGKGDLKSVQAALDRGAQIDARDLTHHFYFTALAYAANEGHLNIARLLLERGAQVNATAQNDDTPLKWAAWNGHTDVVRLLLDHGADHLQAAFNAGVYNGHLATARLLLERGAKVDAIDPENGYTPLLTAAEQNHPEVVRLLLDRGADFHARDHRGRSPLAASAAQGHTEVVRLLLERGAGRIAEDLNGLVHAITRDGSAELLALLLAHGADIRGRNGVEAALDAAYFCNTPVLALLLESGVTLTAAERDEALELVDSSVSRSMLAWMRATMSVEELQELLEMMPGRDVCKRDPAGTKALLHTLLSINP